MVSREHPRVPVIVPTGDRDIPMRFQWELAGAHGRYSGHSRAPDGNPVISRGCSYHGGSSTMTHSRDIFHRTLLG